MRVTFCLDGPDAVNGPNVWLTRHLPLLRGHGITPELLYLSWHPDRPCRFRAMLEETGVPCRNVRLTGFLEDNVGAIVDAVSGDLPDAFVPNYSVPAYFAARFLREAGVATIGTLHSDDPYYHDLVDLFVNGDPLWRLSGVVGVSDFLLEAIGRPGGAPIPYLHAPYGAPVPEAVAQPPLGRFVLAYCGRMVEYQKRILRVASAMVAAARADRRIEGVMWGGGPDADRVAALIAENGMEGRIRMVGVVSPLAMQREMASAHVLVLLSDFEGLSIALMEAMAAGLVPVVARMRSGVTDLIIEGENGIVVDGDDIAGFVREVIALADDPQRWQRLSHAARDTIVSRGYTDAACAEKWADFLDRLVQAAGRRGSVTLPPFQDWGLPPRTHRPDGIRSVDRRSVLFAVGLAVREGRPVYLWGAGGAGEAVLISLRKAGIPIAGFIDSNPAKHGREHCGLPVFPPEHLLSFPERAARLFVAISSQFRTEIVASLARLGLREGDDYPED